MRASLTFLAIVFTSGTFGCSLLVPSPDDYTYAGDGGPMDGSVADADPADAEAADASVDGGVDAGPCAPCSPPTPLCRDDGECVACLDETDCDDGDYCSVDRCGLDGMCTYSPRSGCIQEIVGGGAHSCARRAGRVLCWGGSLFGQVGDGSTMNPVTFPLSAMGLENVSHVAAGAAHTCAVHDGGAVSCWGRTTEGQVGGGSPDAQTAPLAVGGLTDAVDVGAGDTYSCALRTGGRVWCWGTNTTGELGVDTMLRTEAPVEVAGTTDVVQIAAGRFHVCGLLSSGEVICWGSTTNGRLGNGDDSAGLSAAPVPVSGLTDATFVSAGGGHTCALRENRQVVCWGRGTNGEIGDGNEANSAVPATVSNPEGTGPLENVIALAVGGFHVCAALMDGRVVCWGEGTHGQNGGAAENLRPAAVAGVSEAVNLAAGQSHTLAVVAGGTDVVAWGRNEFAQLGDGMVSTEPQPVPRLVGGL